MNEVLKRGEVRIILEVVNSSTRKIVRPSLREDTTVPEK